MRFWQDSMDEFLEDFQFLASFICCTLFWCHSTRWGIYSKPKVGIMMQVFYSSNGFSVLKGSVIAQTMVPSFNWRGKRESFLQEYTIIDDDKRIMIPD